MSMRLFRIKEGRLQQFLDWGKFLQSNPEALETLREEGIQFEAFYYFQVGEDLFAMGVVDNPTPLSPSIRPINIIHRKVLKECLIPLDGAHPIYVLRLDPPNPTLND